MAAEFPEELVIFSLFGDRGFEQPGGRFGLEISESWLESFW
jgi:hypothetical protein